MRNLINQHESSMSFFEMWSLLSYRVYASVTHDIVVDALLEGSQIILVDGTNDTKFTVHVFESGDSVANVDAFFQLLVDDVISL